MRPRRLSRGFTLVELLVVIAIIGILAGLIAAGLPRALEAARLANAENNFTQIRTILIDYNTKHGTFPPSYGYITDLLKGDNRVSAADISAGLTSGVVTPPDIYFLLPWTAMTGTHKEDGLRDTFAKLGYDTDQDGEISRLEFAPIGNYNSSNDTYTFNFNELYEGYNGSNSGETLTDLQRQETTDDTRPYVYIAVNERQFRIFKSIVQADAANSSNPRPFNLSANAIQQINDRLTFPPASYDSFVLISVGPNAAIGTGGILPEFDEDGFLSASAVPEPYHYHILGLAAYFMATRDAENGGEGDGILDFDFKARTREGQGRNADNDLPGPYPKGQGPLIYTGGT